jgi:hypothetical protein
MESFTPEKSTFLKTTSPSFTLISPISLSALKVRSSKMSLSLALIFKLPVCKSVFSFAEPLIVKGSFIITLRF